MCLGKGFADIMVRFTISTLLYYHKFEYVNPDFLKEKPLYGPDAEVPLGVIMKKTQRHPLPNAPT